MSSKVYVVFTDDRDHWWSRFLKKGIRHCYILVPSANRIIKFSRTAESFELFTTEAEKGIIDNNYIVCSFVPKKCKRSLFMLNTCVGHTKQILGITNPFILTPYQLYKYLREKHEATQATP